MIYMIQKNVLNSSMLMLTIIFNDLISHDLLKIKIELSLQNVILQSYDMKYNYTYYNDYNKIIFYIVLSNMKFKYTVPKL